MNPKPYTLLDATRLLLAATDCRAPADALADSPADTEDNLRAALLCGLALAMGLTVDDNERTAARQAS